MALFRESMLTMASVVGPLLVGAMLLGGLIAFVQVGPVFSPAALKPTLDRVNPLASFKQRFLSWSAVVEVLKASIKICAIGVIVFLAVRESLHDLVLSFREAPAGLAPITGGLLKAIALRSFAVLAVIAAADFAFQRWQYQQRHMMTRPDAIREQKQSYGDPQIRSRRQRLHREILAHNMVEGTKNASVIIRKRGK